MVVIVCNIKIISILQGNILKLLNIHHLIYFVLGLTLVGPPVPFMLLPNEFVVLSLSCGEPKRNYKLTQSLPPRILTSNQFKMNTTPNLERENKFYKIIRGLCAEAGRAINTVLPS